jgi:phosphoserine aminotransferase
MFQINFTPGPSQLYFTVEGHMRQAFRDGIPSISHRSKAFEKIYAEVTERLSALLKLPGDYHLVFTASATEIWERSIENLVLNRSYHFVNGAFSKRYFEIAGQLRKNPTKSEQPLGRGFLEPVADGDADLIALTHNETSTGVALSTSFIHAFKEKYQSALVIVDAVSSLPYPDFDYSKIDSVFFSVQKAFGLPAGLGVWLVNDRCVARAENLLSQGQAIGSYHSLPSLISNAKKNQTPETPNVLAIYLLSKVLFDFNEKGIDQIRKETDYKAALLYQTLEGHSNLEPFVQTKNDRSKTVIVAEAGIHTDRLTQWLTARGLHPGDGYGTKKKEQLRFANFPTHSKEQFEMLVDAINDFEN